MSKIILEIFFVFLDFMTGFTTVLFLLINCQYRDTLERKRDFLAALFLLFLLSAQLISWIESAFGKMSSDWRDYAFIATLAGVGLAGIYFLLDRDRWLK